MPLYLRAGVGPIRYSKRLTGNRHRPSRPATRGAHIFSCIFAAIIMGTLGVTTIAHGYVSSGVTILIAGTLVVLYQLAKTPRR